MLTHYLITAIRNLSKHPAYALINLIGLSVGLTCAVLVFLHAHHQFSYDRYHEKANRIYRVTAEWRFENGDPTQNFPMVSALAAPTILEDIPQVEAAVRFVPIKYGPKSLFRESPSVSAYEENGHFCDPNVFDVFSWPFVAGDQGTALTDQGSIVLSERLATKYFGTQSPVGKILTVRDSIALTVTGVVANLPANSHFTFDFLIPIDLQMREGLGRPHQWGIRRHRRRPDPSPARDAHLVGARCARTSRWARLRNISCRYPVALLPIRCLETRHFLCNRKSWVSGRFAVRDLNVPGMCNGCRLRPDSAHDAAECWI